MSYNFAKKCRRYVGGEPTYTFTEKQLQIWQKEAADKIRKEIKEELKAEKKSLTQEAINIAFILLLSIPVKVLHEKYGWRAKKRLPDFANAVCDEYERFCDGEVTIKEYQKLVQDLTGIGFTTNEELAEECPV